MKKSRSYRNKKKHLSSKYLLLILSGVCIMAIFVSLVFNISGGPLNAVAGYVFVPMQKGINSAGSWISSKANDFKTLGEVLQENKELQKQVDDLTVELNKTKLEQYELDNYRELLDLDKQYADYDKVAANVIAMDGTNWFSTFTIDKGKKQGDPVVTSYVSDKYLQGILIGYIYNVEDNANNLTKSGSITPVVDFQHLQEVLVITTLKNTGDLSSKTESDTENTQDTQTQSGE